MSRHRFLLCVAAGLLLTVGCGPSQVLVKVTSRPEGATVYLDGVEKGLTPLEKLLVNFVNNPNPKLTVSMDGHQTEEKLLFPDETEDRPVLHFSLEEAPQVESVYKRLENLQQQQENTNQRLIELNGRLDRIQQQLEELKPGEDTGS